MIALQTIRGDDPKRYKEIFLNKIYSKNLFRPITSREAGRLQGFPFWFAVHPKEASAKKQFGNAVSVPVVYALGEKVISAIIGATSERN
jgi:DNA (cytosine-5)-methyltransferase 1